MKRSIIYLLVLLAVCSISLTLTPQTQGQASNIKIVSYSWYIDSLGYLTVVGEVQNTGSNTVQSIILTGTVSTPNGEVPSYTQAYASYLIPQQKAPFYMEFQPDQSIGNWYTVEITGVNLSVYQANATSSYSYPDIKVSSQQAYIGAGTTDAGVYWVSGQIQNTGSQTAKNVRILGTFYNSTGAVVAVGGYLSETVSASLAPSTSASFKFGAFDLNQSEVSPDKKISTYSLLIQVEEPVLQGTAPSITPTKPPAPATSNSPGNTPTPTSITPGSNPASDQTLIYVAVAAVVIVVVVAAALVFLRKHKK